MCLSNASDSRLYGLGSGGKHLALSTKTRRRLREIDALCGWTKKLSMPFIRDFVADLRAEISSKANGDASHAVSLAAPHENVVIKVDTDAVVDDVSVQPSHSFLTGGTAGMCQSLHAADFEVVGILTDLDVDIVDVITPVTVLDDSDAAAASTAFEVDLPSAHLVDDVGEHAGNVDSFNAELLHPCSCGVPSMVMTVSKDGPNKGRSFYICRGRACDHFQWTDDVQLAALAVGGSRSSFFLGQ